MVLRNVWLLSILVACASQGPAGAPVQAPAPQPPICEREVANWPSVRQEVRLAPPKDAPGGRHAVSMAVWISVEGKVTGIQLVERSGPPFDETARAAMARFLFDPGRDRQGQPVACTINYRYLFQGE